MTTLTDFLLARIDEDEEAARRAINLNDQDRARLSGAGPIGATGDSHLGVNYDRSSVEISTVRVLAECEAKRRIVEGIAPEVEHIDFVWRDLLSTLTLPYADHPDYDEAWRP